MKFSTSFAAICALTSSMLVEAAPLRRRQVSTFSTSTSFTSGAAYFITNEPSGNSVVSADIGADGTLTLAKSFITNGAGAHGNDGKNGFDPLFSQGAVQVNAAAGLLGVVNPGSNSVSLFKIDPNMPSTLTPVGSPMASGGEFPMSLAFNEAGTMLCVLNGGAANGVKCFAVDPTMGLMTMADSWRSLNLNQTTPPTGPAGSASHLIFTEDEQNIIAAVKGDPSTGLPGFLASWPLNGGQTLSPMYTRIEIPEGGAMPFSLGVIPGRNALFATDAAVGTSVYDLSGGMGAATASPATAAFSIPNQQAICWNAYSNTTGNFYVSDILTSLVTEVNVSDNLTASMVAQYPTAPNAAALDLEVASVNGNDYLYVMLPNVTSVQVMSLDGPGQATIIQTMNLTQPAAAANLAFTPTNLQGMAVYVKPPMAQ